ncbi:hypothetical protein LSPH24S_07281 [Lysinibacillus sphaericus]
MEYSQFEENTQAMTVQYIRMVCPNYKGEKFYEMRPAVSGENLIITASGAAPF